MSKDTAHIMISFIQLCIIGGTAVFAIIQYLQNQADNRISEVLDFVERSYQPSFSAPYENVVKLWGNALREHTDVIENCKGQECTDFVIAMVERERVGLDIVKVVGFYESLAICIDENICDRSTAERFFGEDALSFKQVFFPYIQWLRQTIYREAFGAEFESFVNQYERPASHFRAFPRRIGR